MKYSLMARMAWRDWSSGELRLLLVGIVLAVATVTAIGLFVDRLERALLSEAADFLAADRYVGSSRPFPAGFYDEVDRQGVDYADTLSFPSMIFARERNQLAAVKAVSEGYPLRGVLRVADEPFGSSRPTSELPMPGSVWLDSRLFPALSVAVGDEVEIGYARLVVGGVVVTEPDRGGGLFDLGPRVLMNIADVPQTRVIQPGSRVRYRLLLRGEDAQLDRLREALPLTEDHRWVSIRESSPSIGSALERAERFLLLGGLLAVLLAALAVAVCAHRYAYRHFDHVAILKTFGATPREAFWHFLGILALVACAGIVVGLACGYGIHVAIVRALTALIPVALPEPGWRPVWLGAATGAVCTLAFAAPPFLQLKDISPLRVIRRDLAVADRNGLVVYGAAAVGVVVLLVWYTGSWWMTGVTLGGSAGVLVLFGALAWGLLGGVRAVGMQAGSYWRLALNGLQRRRSENVAQMLVFGLAVMLLLLLVLLRTSLLDEWQAQVPVDAPNHFVMNLAPDQVEAFRETMSERGLAMAEPFSMVRGRISAVNGGDPLAHQAAHRKPGEPGPEIDSERNLTWRETLPDGNRVVAGQWWSADARGSVSLEEEYARELGLGVGDRLTFTIAGSAFDAVVSSIRRVEWESMQPNFFIILSPDVLADFPATYMTSFRLDLADKRWLNELLSRFPTVTVIEVDALIEQVQRIIERVSRAIELVMYLVLAGGALVLAATIQASRDSRMAEHALLRTLGGSRRLIAGALSVEFLVLGALAGTLAAVGAEVLAAWLQVQVFELQWRLHPVVWIAGPLLGALLIWGVGMMATRQLISAPPALVLRRLGGA